MTTREVFGDCKLILECVCHSQLLASWAADLQSVLDSVLGTANCEQFPLSLQEGE